ncbi:hypothetical protein T4E_1498 [Trichinella pseudospiralis]|uniref:Uncharacterized protein n=1 Tax=Trichinella pseudospiralis TaxID=6337 RepID=A0A0V0YLN1_TRIPS|nr:hypothetical protein T4E_1498 [Trichinella pseudospiralis]
MEKELFYQIAENDGIVTTFLEEISCQRLPDEVNFFPLNRIQYSQYEYFHEIETIIVITYCILTSFFRKRKNDAMKKLDECGSLPWVAICQYHYHSVLAMREKLLMRKGNSMEIGEVLQLVIGVISQLEQKNATCLYS